MSLNEKQAAVLVRERLGLDSSEEPRIMTMILPALDKLARDVAADVTKRYLLMTDKSSVTQSISNTNQDYYAELSALGTTSGVLLDYLEYGTVFFTYQSKLFTTVSSNQASITTHELITGLKVQLTTTGTLPTGLNTGTDYYIVAVDANTVSFATSRANAFAGTVITISGGSGNHTIVPWEQEKVQFTNREFGTLQNGLPVNYVFGWLVGTKLYTSKTTGTFGFNVPFVPTLSTLPSRLEADFIDTLVELYQSGSEVSNASK